MFQYAQAEARSLRVRARPAIVQGVRINKAQMAKLAAAEADARRIEAAKAREAAAISPASSPRGTSPRPHQPGWSSEW